MGHAVVTRFRVRRDVNHKAVVDTLRAAGCLVADAAALGGGFPDLVCAHARVGVRLLEVKRPTERGRVFASDTKLRPSQVAFHRQWADYAIVVRTPAEALRAMGIEVLPERRTPAVRRRT